MSNLQEIKADLKQYSSEYEDDFLNFYNSLTTTERMIFISFSVVVGITFLVTFVLVIYFLFF